MPQSIKVIFKPSILDKEKLLIIEPEYLEFDTINFSKLDITDIRYGLRAIKGYRFRIGRIYCIDIKSVSDTIIKIRLKSIYHIRKKKLEEKYFAILSALFDNYMNDISWSYTKMFQSKIDFHLLGIFFTQQGLILEKKGSLILWSDVGTKNYYRYHAVFSKTDAHKYKAFYYLTDWNAIILRSVLSYILKTDGNS